MQEFAHFFDEVSVTGVGGAMIGGFSRVFLG